MHDIHIKIPWNRLDEWHSWMDQMCPGWFAYGQTRCGYSIAGWRNYLAEIQHDVMGRNEGHVEANYAIAVDTDQQLMLLRLTWNVLHTGHCRYAKCKNKVFRDDPNWD